MEREKVYYAKSQQADGHQPTVKEHLEKVAVLAEEFGAKAGCPKEAMLAGQMHDFGKYSVAFQKRIIEKYKYGSGVDHAICGAAILYNFTKKARPYRCVLEAISGHHKGLVEFGELKSVLEHNLKDNEPIERDGKFSALSGAAQYSTAFDVFRSDFPEFRIPRIREMERSLIDETEDVDINEMLKTRMVFSCLVDADYSISASDENPNYLKETGSIEFDAGKILEKLYSYRENIRKASNSEKRLNEIRDLVFEGCGDAGGSDEEGLFTLTAPTGVGKTLALLHFALRHCIAKEKERIIIVLPFLTLTEQNADTYRKIFPYLLEDHSQRDLDDREREYAARWSAPFIVTTSVRFFESLFAYKPTDCRKLHHIANSVVVFDEAQSLPADVTVSTLQAVNELCKKYRCTMVFSTATQPDFDSIKKITWKPKEIIPDNKSMYAELARTRVEWRTSEKTALYRIAEEMTESSSICVIVNLRRHARKLFEEVKKRCWPEEVFFLTTDLCMDHRRNIVSRIKERLSEGKPCRVVATQCIEAGVDLDFETVYRALGPLDSIIQAAGRCNRNGKLKGRGKVVVFKPDEEEPVYPGKWYEHAAQTVEFILKMHEIDIHDVCCIREYYRLLFDSASDKLNLINAIRLRQYEQVDKQYQLINDEGARIIVPYKSSMEEFNEIRKSALKHGITPFLIKKAVNITVSVSRGKAEQIDIVAERLCYSERHERSERVSDFYVLRPSFEKCYSDDMGLQIGSEIDIDPFVECQ